MSQLAFYIAKHGNIVDKAIAWWTNSKYSHVELVIDGMWYSTSPRDLKVRAKRLIPKEGHWDFVDVDVDTTYAIEFFFLTSGRPYDWLGIWLTQFLPFNLHERKKFFCSEWCARALQYDKAHQYSPEKLYRKVTNAS